MRTALLILSISVLLITGCATVDVVRPGSPEFSPGKPTSLSTMDIKRKKFASGSLYNDNNSISLFETMKAKRIGDVLMVTLSENTQGISTARTQVDKEHTSTIANPTIFGSAFESEKRMPFLLKGPNGSVNLSSTTEFEGESLVNQNNQLTGSISVTVVEVMSNGNLLVRGEKWININSGREFIRLKGIVRPADINPDNTISSQKVADAQITYSGTGQNHNANIMGWLGKFFSSALWMF